MQPTTNEAVGVEIVMEYDQTISYAKQQNDVPVIRRLRITNLSEAFLENVQVEIRTEPQFAETKAISISSLPPMQPCDLGRGDLVLLHDVLLGLTERVQATLEVRVTHRDETLAGRRVLVELLAHNEWDGRASWPELLAAFVLPNHPTVAALLSRTAALLEQQTGNGSLSGYQEAERVPIMVEALYDAVAAEGIRYINPPASFE